MSTLRQRFDHFVHPEPNSGCWLWAGGVGSHGYGMIGIAGNKVGLAHRVSVELHKGPIPRGAHIDHTCRNRICVNPDHLDVVSQAENNRRIVQYGANNNAQKSHCANGHPYSGGNLFIRRSGARGCHACAREARARYRKKVKCERIAP